MAPRCQWCGESAINLDGNYMCPPCSMAAEERYAQEQQERAAYDQMVEDQREQYERERIAALTP